MGATAGVPRPHPDDRLRHGERFLGSGWNLEPRPFHLRLFKSRTRLRFPMLRTTLLGAAASALLVLPAVAGQDPDHSGRTTAIFPLVPDLEEHLTVDADLLGWLADSDRLVMVDTRLPGEPDAAFELERVRLVDERGGLLKVDGEVLGPISHHRSQDLSLWKGQLAGRENTDVFLAFSTAGTWGWARLDNGRTVHLQSGPHPELGWERAQARWIDDAALRRPGFEERFACEVKHADGREVETSFPRGDLGHGPLPGDGQVQGNDQLEGFGGNGAAGGDGGNGLVTSMAPALLATAPMLQQTIYIAEAVIETDYAYYLEFNNLTAATNYTNALLGACSDRYEDQAGCIWDVTSLAFYTSGASDPYSGTNPSDLLFEMRQAWNGSGGLHTLGDFGLILSGWGGGGVAYLDEVCDSGWGVGACCSINGNGNFPVTGQSSLNWDFVVTTHEAGHIFDAVHTHDFCPPVDHCDSNCDGFTQCTVGTIMSYCHTCSFAGVSNIDPFFAAANVTRIRNTVLTKNCLDVYVPPPSQPIIASASPNQVDALYADNWPTITLSGQNFSTVTFVSVDGVTLDASRYTIVDDSTMEIEWNVVSKLGAVNVRVANSAGIGSTNVNVVSPSGALIEMQPSNPFFWLQGSQQLDVYMSGNVGDAIYLTMSTSNVPTDVHGLITMDIGNNFLDLVQLGLHRIQQPVGWKKFAIGAGQASFGWGTTVYFQGAIFPAGGWTFPLTPTNVQSVVAFP